MWEEMFVLIQRILVAVCIGSFTIAAITYVIAKRNTKKSIKISAVRKKTNIKEKQKQQAKEQQKQVETQPTSTFSDDFIIRKMQEDSQQAGLKQFEFGYFTADCLDTNWIKFVQNAVNLGKLEVSKYTENQDNTIVYNKEDVAIFKMQGKGEEMNALLNHAPLSIGDKIVEYYKQINKTKKYVVEPINKKEKPKEDFVLTKDEADIEKE